MCEIMAISARKPVHANPLLRDFFADSPRHPHGWGMAWRTADGVWMDKEPLPAYRSEYLAFLLGSPIRATDLIAHIRNATRGRVTFGNCHPFTAKDASGREWLLAHNGTVLAEELIGCYGATQTGDTDSERVMMYLLAALNDAQDAAGAPLSAQQRFDVLAREVARLSPGNKLNLVMSDGELTYVHTNTIQPTLYLREEEGTTLVCTRPLVGGMRWTPVPRCQLLAFRDGERFATGPEHEALFDNDEYLRIIAQETPLPPLA